MLVYRNTIVKLKDGASIYGGESESCWLFDTVSGRQFRLNDLGYRILSMVDGCLTADAIARRLHDDMPEVPYDRILADAVKFLNECVAKGMASEVE